MELPIPSCPQGEVSSGILLYTLFTVDLAEATWCFAFSSNGRSVQYVVWYFDISSLGCWFRLSGIAPSVLLLSSGKAGP